MNQVPDESTSYYDIMRDPRRHGSGRAADGERPDSRSTAPTTRLPTHEEHWQPNTMQTQHHSGSAFSQPFGKRRFNSSQCKIIALTYACTVTCSSDPIYPIVAAITQFQQDQHENSSNVRRTKDAEISALQDECRTLAELVQKRDQENAWLHKRARQIQEESDKIVAGKVAEERQSYSKSALAKNERIETLEGKCGIQAKIIQGMHNHMGMKVIMAPEMSDGRRLLKRRASAADLH